MKSANRIIKICCIFLSLVLAMSIFFFAEDTPIAQQGLTTIQSAAANNPASVTDGTIRLTKNATPDEDFLNNRRYTVKLGVNDVDSVIVNSDPINYTIIFDTYDVMQSNPAFEFVLSNISDMCRKIWDTNSNSKISIISYSAPKAPTYGVTTGSIEDATLVVDQVGYADRGKVHQALMNYNRQYPFVNYELSVPNNGTSFQGYRVYAGLGNSFYDTYDYVYVDESDKDLYGKPRLIHRIYEVDGVRKPYGFEPELTDNVTAAYYAAFKRDATTGQLLDENGNIITAIKDAWGNFTGYSSEPILLNKLSAPQKIVGTITSMTPVKVTDNEGIFYTNPATGLTVSSAKMIPSASVSDPDNKGNLFATNTNADAAIARLKEVLDQRSSTAKGADDKVIFITDSASSAAIDKPIYNWAQSGTGDTDGVKIATDAVIKRIDSLMQSYPDLQFVPVGLGGFSSAQGNLKPYFDGLNADGSDNAAVTGLLEKLGQYSGGLYDPTKNIFSVEQSSSSVDEQRENINSVFQKAKTDLGIISSTTKTYATPATITDTIPAGFALEEGSVKMYNANGGENTDVIPKIVKNSDGTTTITWTVPSLQTGIKETIFTYALVASDKLFGGNATFAPTNTSAKIDYTKPSDGTKATATFPVPSVYIPYQAEAAGGEDTIMYGESVTLSDYLTAKVFGESSFSPGFREKDLQGKFTYTWKSADGTILHSASDPNFSLSPAQSQTYYLTIESDAVTGYTKEASAGNDAIVVQNKLSLTVPVKINVIDNSITVKKIIQSNVSGISADDLKNARFTFAVNGPCNTNLIVSQNESKTIHGLGYGSYTVTEQAAMNYSFNKVIVKQDGVTLGSYSTNAVSLEFAKSSGTPVSHSYELIYYNDFINQDNMFDYGTIENKIATGSVSVAP